MGHDPNCIFCKIAAGQVPSEKLYDDGEFFVIEDMAPLSPTHLLIIPYKHIPSLMDIPDDKMDLVARAFIIAKKMAVEEKIDELGFRVMNNVRSWGGQVVMHLHFHLLGGEKLE
jgi:histidine triad (HIT) family protein